MADSNVPQPPIDFTTDEWMSACKALESLEAAGYATKAVKDMLADQLRENRIQIGAKVAWTSNEVDLPAAWRTRLGRTDVVRGAVVPAATFKKSRRLAKDPERWDWPKGKFYITTQMKPRVRRMLAGVHFRHDEIAALAKNAGTAARTTSKIVDERPPQKVWWDWVHELTVYLHEEGWKPGMTANELFEKLENRLSEQGLQKPSRSTVYDLAKHLIARAKSDDRIGIS